MQKQINFMGADIQLDRLSKLGDPLEKINETIDWEIFRHSIRKRVRKENYDKGGRPPIDEILMFKITPLQDWNHISDEATEFMVNDRLSFQRFLEMDLEKSRRMQRRYGFLRNNLEKKVYGNCSTFST